MNWETEAVEMESNSKKNGRIGYQSTISNNFIQVQKELSVKIDFKSEKKSFSVYQQKFKLCMAPTKCLPQQMKTHHTKIDHNEISGSGWKKETLKMSRGKKNSFGSQKMRIMLKQKL